MDATSWPLWLVIAGFTGAAVVIALAGTVMTRLADRLADLTGLGEALFGAVLLGGSTSLSGVVTSITAAWDGYAELAVSNGVGGIAAQTAFLVIADLSYRKANLEHAAASVENLMQCALLLTLLAFPLLAMSGPELAVFNVHPLSLLLMAGYLYGLHLVRRVRDIPLWYPRTTVDTRADRPGEGGHEGGLARTWAGFAVLAVVVSLAGLLVARTGIALVERTGLSESLVGALLTAVATSLPELVTSIAAVRQGALTLAVGGIIGGNSFDVLFLFFSDVAYRDGSIYHAIGPRPAYIIALNMLLTGILLLGLLRRQTRGLVNIGTEGALVLGFYVGGMTLLFLAG